MTTMKRMTLALAAALLLVPGQQAAAQHEAKAHFKPYGFIRNYAILDSRKSQSLTEEIFYLYPMDVDYASDGTTDRNAVPTLKYQALTTRLGLNIVGYEFGRTKMEGKIEADFYCLNSGGNVPTLRMRQAYTKLNWDNRGRNGIADLSLVLGQAWHPMAADMPHGINLETGVPFNPFNRSAQAMLNLTLWDKLTLTGGILSQLQYRSVGPNGGSNNYQKHALIPEAYFGISFASGGFLARAGVDLLTIKPRYGYNDAGERIKDLLFTASPMLYFQFTSEDFQIKAKSVFGQAGEHLQMMTGYVAYDVSDPLHYKYSPLQQSSSFLSMQYGRALQGMLMLGFLRNFGSIDAVVKAKDSSYPDPDYIYVHAKAAKNVRLMYRICPALVYNLGKMQFALEYNLTGAQYGAVDKLDLYGLASTDLHMVYNHRVSLMTKFNF